MKRDEIERRILAARPDGSPVDTDFTNRVMDKISQCEIFAEVVRKTNGQPKETFVMKLRNLHKPVMAVIALASALAIGGTAYALYLLWPQPIVETGKSSIGQSGRTELTALLKGCGVRSDGTKIYELKQGATISAEQIPDVLRARCEIEAIQQWTDKEFPTDFGRETTKPYDRTQISYPSVQQVAALDGVTVTLAAQPRYGLSEEQLTVGSGVKVIRGGAIGSLGDIKVGDAVVALKMQTIHMTPNPSGGMTGTPKSAKLLYLVRLDLPFATYDPQAFQSIAMREPCSGNEQDTCVESGSVDLFSGAGQSAATVQASRVLQGKITSINGNAFTLQGSSGREVTFTMNSNIVEVYNRDRSANYRNVKIGVGDMLEVRYAEPSGVHAPTIPEAQVVFVGYMIELVNKNDSLKKY